MTKKQAFCVFLRGLFYALEEGGDILDILIREWCCHTIHDGVFPSAIPECSELLIDVLGMLAGQYGIHRISAPPSRAMAYLAGACLVLAVCHITNRESRAGEKECQKQC